jgi:CubicO group peptidase (beta-lactamase class C family)
MRKNGLAARVQAEMAQKGIPGLAAAVGVGAKIAWSGAFGVADLENSVQVTERTIFRAASVSKTLTAVAVMQLVQKKKIALDEEARRYVPEFPRKKKPVLVRALLAHMAGIRQVTSEESAITRHMHSTKEGLSLFWREPLAYVPGAQFLYTGLGYNLLGAIIEGASGLAYPEYVKEHVLGPARMERTCVDDVFAIIPGRAQGYRIRDGRIENSALVDSSYKIPSGGWCSTPDDLVRFGLAILDGTLLDAPTRAEMFIPERLKSGGTPELIRQGKKCSYALGWYVSKRHGETEVWHLGGMRRVTTILYLVPDRRLAVAVMCNLEEASLIALADQLADDVVRGI